MTLNLIKRYRVDVRLYLLPKVKMQIPTPDEVRELARYQKSKRFRYFILPILKLLNWLGWEHK